MTRNGSPAGKSMTQVRRLSAAMGSSGKVASTMCCPGARLPTCGWNSGPVTVEAFPRTASWVAGTVGAVTDEAAGAGQDFMQGAKGVDGGAVRMVSTYAR